MKSTYYILGTANGKVFLSKSLDGTKITATDHEEEAERFLVGKGFDERPHMLTIIAMAKQQHCIDLVPFELAISHKPSNILEN